VKDNMDQEHQNRNGKNAYQERVSGMIDGTIENANINTIDVKGNGASNERAILIGLETSSGYSGYSGYGEGRIIGGRTEEERSLDELEELAHTAGVTVVGKMLQKRPVRDSAHYIGSGKLEELGMFCNNMDAGTAIFDDELSGAQIRNIEEAIGVKVIDRTTLILDIFAQRAHSREGKIQVELAQLKYRLPRLTGMGGQLSRLGGGIGTRGPGEKKLETDRRHIRRRINYLETELKEVRKQRELIRENRRRNEFPTVALVGYTNAGKSTLLNKLCGADVFVEDKLFATLDPTTRKLAFSANVFGQTGQSNDDDNTLTDVERDILLIDTVGFIRKLPTELIEAFKSTLEEAVYADALIHVVDATDEEYEEHIKVVNEILHSLGAENKPVILALNKIDLFDANKVNEANEGNERIPERIPIKSAYGDLYSEVCEISAITGHGLDDLVKSIEGILSVNKVELNLMVPYNEGWVLPYIYENGRILEKDFADKGIKAKVVIENSKAYKIMKYAEINTIS